MFIIDYVNGSIYDINKVDDCSNIKEYLDEKYPFSKHNNLTEYDIIEFIASKHGITTSEYLYDSVINGLLDDEEIRLFIEYLICKSNYIFPETEQLKNIMNIINTMFDNGIIDKINYEKIKNEVE